MKPSRVKTRSASKMLEFHAAFGTDLNGYRPATIAPALSVSPNVWGKSS